MGYEVKVWMWDWVGGSGDVGWVYYGKKDFLDHDAACKFAQAKRKVGRLVEDIQEAMENQEKPHPNVFYL